MERNNDDLRTSGVPENDPSKAMDSKREVEQSNDEKTDQDFPGYPHYPSKEDMMDKRTGSHRVDMDIENSSSNRNNSGVDQRFLAGQNRQKSENAMTPQPGLGNDDMDSQENDSDVNSDDLAALNSTNDEIGVPQNVSDDDINTDLDVPGSELDDDNENIGEEDEENNYYSLGGDRQEANEEDPYSGPDRS